MTGRSSTGRRVKIGVAFPVPEPWGGELQQWRQHFGDPQADAIPTHVTLLPPTDVRASEVPDVEEHLLKVAAEEEPFDMRLRGTGSFRPVSPVVYVRVVRGVGACRRLEGKVRSGVLHRRLSYPYHPHVTIAHDLEDQVLDRAVAALSAYDAHFQVSSFSLYEHMAARWQPRRSFSLAGSITGSAPPGVCTTNLG